VEPVLRDLALYIDKTRFNVHFFFMVTAGAYKDEMIKAGHAVTVIPAKNGYDIRARFNLILGLIKFKPAVIQDHGMPPFIRPLVKLATGKPLLTFDHGIIDINRKRGKKWKNLIYGLELRLFCKGIAFNSFVNMKDVTTSYNLSKKQIDVVHLGLDLSRFEKVSNEDVSLSSNMVLGFIGRVHHDDKGTDYLPSVALNLIQHGFANFTVQVIGDGPDLQNLKNQVRKQNIDRYFEFFGHRTDVPKLLKSIDIVLVPSRTEAFGLSPLEGLAAGCRVVAFKAGALNEVLSECEDAFLVDSGDVDAMAQKVIALWDEYHKNRAAGALMFVRNRYEVNRMVQTIENLFYKALNIETNTKKALSR
jgi:glycosyltransferase involved in cell wall biosynthesis